MTPRALLLPLLALAAAFLASPVRAAEFPTKPVTLIVPFPPGGGADVVARLLAARLQAAWKQPVLVDNRAGASGNVGSELVARAAPDGHTLLLHNSTLTINPGIGMRQAFDVRRDLAPVATVASTPLAIAVHPSLAVKSVAELVAYAKQHPGKLSWSSCGNGSPQHFAGAQFTQRAGAPMVHIPYKGCAPAVVDGVGGQVPVLFNTVPNLDPHVKAGRLRYLGVASARRVPFLPEVPTISETPGLQGFAADVWFGVLAPAGTPKPLLAQIERDVSKAAEDKELQEALVTRLFAPQVLPAAAFGKLLDGELASFKRLAGEFHVVPE